MCFGWFQTMKSEGVIATILECTTGMSRQKWKLSLHLDYREKISVWTIIWHPKSAIFSCRSIQNFDVTWESWLWYDNPKEIIRMHFTECATLLFYPLCDLLYPTISWWDFVSYKTVREMTDNLRCPTAL